MDKTQSRLRRARQTRIKIAELQVARLAVHRTNTHIYAQVVSPCGTKVLASASTLEAEVRAQLADQSGKRGNVAPAALVGKRIAERGGGAGSECVGVGRGGWGGQGGGGALGGGGGGGGLKL